MSSTRPTTSEQRTEVNYKQLIAETGTDAQRSNESSDTLGEAKDVTTTAGETQRTSETTRGLTGRTVTSEKSGERVNVGLKVSFSVNVRNPIPVIPGQSSC